MLGAFDLGNTRRVNLVLTRQRAPGGRPPGLPGWSVVPLCLCQVSTVWRHVGVTGQEDDYGDEVREAEQQRRRSQANVNKKHAMAVQCRPEPPARLPELGPPALG